MKLLILAALLVAAVQANVDWSKIKHVDRAMPVNPASTWDGHKIFGFSKNDGRIINGSPAILGQFPWQAALIMDRSSFCGGSLISSRWVLTAGHCTVKHIEVTVTLGTTSLVEKPTESVTLQTQDKITHEKYDDVLLNFDIALVHLPTDVSPNEYINVIPLATRDMTSLDGVRTRLSGWGAVIGGGSVSYDLNYVDLYVIKNAECKKVYGDAINDDKLCTLGVNGGSSCSGDSGGPLVVNLQNEKWIQIGIVSFGSQGCQITYPSGFTRVTSYLDWIKEKSGIDV